MHELQVTESILEIVLRHAKAARASRVISIRLSIGELSDLESDWVQKYFDYLSKDTIADKALLYIDKIPVQLRCEACARVFAVDGREALQAALCPDCGCERFAVVAGREYKIEDMKVL
jgi:hydrogenase nickel incorporation protein HypA/HybF